MFHEHNGHKLKQISEVASNVNLSMAQLFQEIKNARSKLLLSQQLIEKSISTIDQMRQKQNEYINEGFKLIVKGLKTRMEEMLGDFSSKFEYERDKF